MGMPVQPTGATGEKCTIELLSEYIECLKDFNGFSYIVLPYVFHRSAGYNTAVILFPDAVPRGLFLTQAAKRPNPIGLSIVKLNKIEGSTLVVENVDIVDGTPLLDIKPKLPEFYSPQDRLMTGWL